MLLRTHDMKRHLMIGQIDGIAIFDPNSLVALEPTAVHPGPVVTEIDCENGVTC
jgi:hypothetical protein